MTTVACKWTSAGWVVAADTYVYGYIAVMAGMRKITKTPGGNLVGVSGDAGFAAKFLAWARGGFEGAWVDGNETDDTVDAAFVTYTVAGSPIVRIFEGKSVFDMHTSLYAIGSGRPLALGAMAAGASVERAVEIACQYDPMSGGEVQTLAHSGPVSLPEPLIGRLPNPLV